MTKNYKINIYVPQQVGALLENDAKQFEIVKGDGFTINKNKFLSMLIAGYYDLYSKEMETVYESILAVLKTSNEGVYEQQQGHIAKEILEKVFLPKVPPRKGKNPVKLSLKPTKEILPKIKQYDESWGGETYVSQFFCKLLMSYCQKPSYIREQIVFKNNYEKLKDACEKGIPTYFTTIWNKTTVHKVIPYKIVCSKEEMFNYIMCEEIEKGKKVAKSYRLNRIFEPTCIGAPEQISDDVRKYLEMTIKYAPQFAINEETLSSVYLNDEGIKTFNRIYTGRPLVKKRELADNGWCLYFECSEEQLYQYFKRFERNKYTVISPNALKERLLEFYNK